MKFDFHAAAHRHWRDAELLHRDARRANADQLYGLAAECALKRLAVGHGWAKTTVDGDIDESDRKVKSHINVLWGRFQTLLRGRSVSWSGYLATANPFADWRVDQRYSADSHLPAETQVAMHRAAAEASLRALEQWTLSRGTP